MTFGPAALMRPALSHSDFSRSDAAGFLGLCEQAYYPTAGCETAPKMGQIIAGTRTLTPKDVKNEQVKLFASYLNIMAAGVMVGALVPAPLALYWGSNRLDVSTKVLIEIILVMTSWILTWLAQLNLRRLQ